MRPRLLDVQYRMHPLIADFPSRNFYAGRLMSGVDAAARPLPRGAPRAPPPHSIALAGPCERASQLVCSPLESAEYLVPGSVTGCVAPPSMWFVI